MMCLYFRNHIIIKFPYFEEIHFVESNQDNLIPISDLARFRGKSKQPYTGSIETGSGQNSVFLSIEGEHVCYLI